MLACGIRRLLNDQRTSRSMCLRGHNGIHDTSSSRGSKYSNTERRVRATALRPKDHIEAVASPGVRRRESSARLVGPQHAPSGPTVPHSECGWKRGEIRVREPEPRSVVRVSMVLDRTIERQSPALTPHRVWRIPTPGRALRQTRRAAARAPPDKGGDQESPFDILAFSWKDAEDAEE